MTPPPLAVNLRALRKSRRLTQAELADMSRVSQPTISSVERGDRKPNAGVVEALAAALGADADALLSPKSCPNCHGEPGRALVCQVCGTAGEPFESQERSVAA